MVTPKKASLKAALEGKQAPAHTPAPAAPAPAAPATNGRTQVRGSAITGYFDKSVQREMRMLALRENTTVGKLLGEALNLLFEKRKMPQIADVTPVQGA